MKKLKWLFLVFVSFLTLSIIGFSLWLVQLNSQIKESLEKRTFQQPTEYFSAPRLFSVSPSKNKDFWIQTLQQENFRQRDITQPLRPGEFLLLDQENCRRKLTSESQNLENFSDCVVLKTQETPDPFSLLHSEQIAVFDQEGTWIDAFAVSEGLPRRVTHLALNSRKVAQYISGKPILQVYHPLGEIPPQCLNSVLAIEDSKFLDHQGVSVTGILRAILNNLMGGPRQGGSTITQQLVKNDYLTPEKTLKRKFVEFFMSLLLEFHSSKDQIFESYLNVIYLGQSGPFQVIGFGAASEYYFGKTLGETNLAECALLAAVLNSPGLYNPFTKPENATKRRNLVLERMQQLGFIDEIEKTTAQGSPLPQNRNLPISETAPYFFNLVSQELSQKGFIEKGQQVFTTLNIEQQEAAQKSIQNGLSQLENNHKKIQDLKSRGFQLEGALIAVDLERSWISAVVGGRSFRMTQFNRAIQGQRQIGSVFKPLVFLEYFERFPEENLLSLVDDRKTTLKYEGQTWSPDNYGKKHYEDVPVYFALKNSLNSSTVHLAMKAGLQNIKDLSYDMGATSSLMVVPSMA
ncbi:MAG: transglycosylase domain-containing protein, partial [Pseudobdellovibrionaceae bacterium]